MILIHLVNSLEVFALALIHLNLETLNLLSQFLNVRDVSIVLGLVILSIALNLFGEVCDVHLNITALRLTFDKVPSLIYNFFFDVSKCAEFAIERDQSSFHPLDFNIFFANGELELLLLFMNNSNAII